MTRVLIVEDDEPIQQMYAKAFKFRKFYVEVVSDGFEAIKKIEAMRPDAILLDIMMPKMNGIETLEKLKANPATKEIPVIMLTNIADDKYIKQAKDKGALNYVVKSEYVPKDVVDLVQKTLGSSPPA